MKIVLFGYYGYKNIGDDLMLENLLNYFLKIEKIKKIYVFTKNNYYPAYNRVEYIVHQNSISKFKRILKIIESDIIIWGGGTCLYDNDGLKNLYNYMRLSNFLGKYFAFLGIGIGELKEKKSIDMANFMLKNSNFVYFRDTQSKNYLNIDSCVGGDLVFLSDYREKKFANRNSIKNISFSGIEIKTVDINLYIDFLRKLIEEYKITIHFIPAHIEDMVFHKKLLLYLPNNSVKVYNYNSDNYINILQNMDFHIGMRLHSIVLADILGIPNIAIKYAKKVEKYINKTNNLSNLRLFQINQAINYKDIEQIYKKYRYDSKFIQNEKRDAYECLSEFIKKII